MHTLGDYFRQHAAEVTTLRAGFRATMLDELARTSWCCRRGRGARRTSTATSCCRELDARNLPAFGVCLGLQAMVEHAGGELSLLPEPQHGKPGQILVRAETVAARRPAAGVHGGPLPLAVRDGNRRQGRVHRDRDDPDGVVMAIEDDAAGRWAVQFHPESILTAAGRSGHQVIANVLASCRARLAATA